MSETNCELIGGPHDGIWMMVFDGCNTVSIPASGKKIRYRRISPTQFKYVEESK